MKLKELEPLLRGGIMIQEEGAGTMKCMPGTDIVRRAYANYTVVSVKAQSDPIDPDILITVREETTTKVNKVRQGHWSSKMVLVRDILGDCHAGFQCSECKAILNKTNYCGNCGAKMIKEDK